MDSLVVGLAPKKGTKKQNKKYSVADYYMNILEPDDNTCTALKHTLLSGLESARSESQGNIWL